ncbi:DUF3703 domain-containing protein [Sphingopyxis sp.]|uniref:DUF3703 domain-containing protein n=1 Tax=Sphingopyxis sp. TaxID=1908224 RepID=UPI003F712C13
MNLASRQNAQTLIAIEMDKYRICQGAADLDGAWRALERAHIVAQPFFGPHWASHWQMAGFALALQDWREVAGQLFRLALVPLGSLTSRLPEGNTGRARVSAFKPMPVPADLAVAISPGDKQEQDR